MLTGNDISYIYLPTFVLKILLYIHNQLTFLYEAEQRDEETFQFYMLSVLNFYNKNQKILLLKHKEECL